MAKKKILINVDCFFDMRLACLSLIKQDMASDLMKGNEYYLRTNDYFKWGNDTLDRGKFREVLGRYGDDILKKSIPTKLHYFITELINYYLASIGRTPWLTVLGVELNTHPYKIDETQLKFIIEIYRRHVCDAIPISVVNIPMANLNPELVAREYVALFMYDPCPWLDLHVEPIKKRVVHDVGLFVPEIWHGDIVSEKVLEEAKSAGLADPVTFTSKIMDTFISFRYLPPAYFCADTSWNKKEYLGDPIPE